MTEFAGRDEFELDNPWRHFSPESDYGVHWRDGQHAWPQWRVSYIRDTGEVYAIEQSGLLRVRLLGTVKPDLVPAGRDDLTYYRTLDAILDGWADPDVSGFDLGWVAARLARAGAR
jgi:hypothetical protein